MPPQDAVGARWSAGLLVGAGSGARLAAKTLKAAENNASPKTDLVTIGATVKRKFKQNKKRDTFEMPHNI